MQLPAAPVPPIAWLSRALGHMTSFEIILLATALLLVLSVVSGQLSDRLGVPGLLVFLLIGMLAGSEGLGGVPFDDAELAQRVGIVALVFILFAGGLLTSWASVRSVLVPAIALSTAGVLLTALLVGGFASWFLDLTLLEGFLLGAIVSSTDAAAVFAVLRARRTSLTAQVRALLELESGSNDPMAVFLTVACTQLIAVPGGPVAALLPVFAVQMTLGAVVGLAFGRAMVLTVNRLRLEYDGLYPVLTIGMVLLCYAATAGCGGNGFLAVYVAGIAMGSQRFRHRNSLVRFHDGLAWLMQIAMFVVLGLLVFPSRLLPVAASALAVVAFLMLVARPVSVLLVLAGTRFTLPEKLMVGWVGLRGAVPIVLATFPLLANVPDAEVIFDLVFFIVLVSVAIQGPSIPWIARRLGVAAPLRVPQHYPIEFESQAEVDAELLELIVPAAAAAAGRRLVDIPLPPGTLVVLICRDEQFIVPDGTTSIAAGDVVLVLCSRAAMAEAQARLTAPAS